METIERYRQTARIRQQARQERVSQRHQQAWETAKRAATLLKNEFGATRVVAFGSLLHPQLFHLHSDIDLAVWGLNERDYYRAVSCLLSLTPGIDIDLIEFEHARKTLQTVIQNNGAIL